MLSSWQATWGCGGDPARGADAEIRCRSQGGADHLERMGDGGGLEVNTTSGDWVRADPIPGTFVVNLGDLLHRWSNGLYHSALHRVMNNRAQRNRHSIVLFFNPAYDTRVECLPTCIKPGEIAKFPPCTAGEHTKQRYDESRRHLQPTENDV